MTAPCTSRPGAGPGLCALLGLAILTVGPGCKGDGLSDYERNKKKQGEAVAALQQAGGKLVEKHYPQGEAWSANLRGVQITDETFTHLQSLGRVSELDLSKSTVTDDHLAKVNDIGNVILKLDLSHTAVTDAGLEKLTSLYFLGDFNLTGSKVTPAGVERFKQSRLSDPKVQVKQPNIRR